MRTVLISALSGFALALNDQQWSSFKAKYAKTYDTALEEQAHFRTFRSNVGAIKRHNDENRSYTKAVNQFTDLTFEQFARQRLMTLPYPEDSSMFECPLKYETVVSDWGEFGTSLDWRNTDNPKGLKATVAVKDQASCGSCYAFSSTAAMEGSLCINGYQNCSDFEGLSEQHILDCGSYDDVEEMKPWYGFNGCHGGWQSNVFQYIYRNNGISCLGKYPYVSGNDTYYPDNSMNIGECAYDATMSHGAPDKDICGTINKHDWTDKTAELMKSALLEKGPLAVGIKVGDGFRSYEGGVLRVADAAEECPDLEEVGISHAITAVGYGQEEIDGEMVSYWILRNSWSADWGDAGHLKIEMGGNFCGIEGNVQFVNMKPGPPEEPEAVKEQISVV